jgi:hypothetical protein
VFALYGAHQVPECVRSVVTLGSPISVDPEGSAPPPLVTAMHHDHHRWAGRPHLAAAGNCGRKS